MKTRRINADKPHLWKADIAASVDQFNQWFMRFAPAAFRSTRLETTEHVKAALLATSDLRMLNAATLKANPGALPTLRMCTAPPLAVDRLVGRSETGPTAHDQACPWPDRPRRGAFGWHAQVLLRRHSWPYSNAAGNEFSQSRTRGPGEPGRKSEIADGGPSSWHLPCAERCRGAIVEAWPITDNTTDGEHAYESVE